MNSMIAFDTNVLIYACDKRDSVRQAVAIELLEQTPEGAMLWQVACEFIAASRKLRNQGLSPVEAWDHLARFLRTFRLVLPSPGVLDRARVLHVEQQWSFWDAMIVAACVDADVTRLYSEDLPGRAAPNELEIVNPFA